MPLLTPPRVLSGHVEAAAVHAAASVGVFDCLSRGAATAESLANACGLDVRGVAALLAALAALDLVESTTTGFALKRSLPDLSRVAGASQAWSALESRTPDFAGLLEAAENACSDSDPLIELAWQHVWSAAVIELAVRGTFVTLQDTPRPCASLDVPAGLLAAAQRTGVLAVDGHAVRLTAQARAAFGAPSVKQFGAWMQQRMRMEREYFWQPLGALSACLRTGQPATRTSAPGWSGEFRATFTRVNEPLLPTLRAVAQRVVQALGGARRPWSVLEVGASVGYWGMTLAAAHPQTTVLSVDAREALLETQRLVASAGLSSRYTWHAASAPATHGHLCSGPFDVIVLHEICHTLSPAELDESLALARARLAPDGMLLIADMLLDEPRTAPRRHVMSGLKLLVTGGGALLDTASAPHLLAAHGFSSARVQRLPTTDLVLARPG